MDKQQATRLIRDTFESAFDEAQYLRFARELLNGQIDESPGRKIDHSGNLIPNAFKGHVRRYKRIGTYTDPTGEPIDLLIVYLHQDHSLDRARTMQRNFAAYHLKQRTADNAIIAYVSDSLADWRFSMVRREPVVTFSEAGNLIAKDELTPVRRYSFLVGQNERSHTAQQQLFPILLDDKHDPTLDRLEEAFNIETVTKEFFERYKELFLQLKEELDRLVAKDSRVQAEFTAKELDTANFAKKLLGQIVFLYFLQKKGWLGVSEGATWGEGPKDFLHQLFDRKWVMYDNFFNDILEPLFYEALAIERDDNLYRKLNTRIPFLNGGLFEPMNNYDWQNTDILIDNGVFADIFNTFDLYNFTVREDEPLEKEVAVDPEMLGKVFENLLEVKDRKSKGAFYTPREIVHYMCQESLINYLSTAIGDAVPRDDLATFIRVGELAVQNDIAKEGGTVTYKYQMPESIRENAPEIDEAMASIKICDPAIGSGAFPVGMMQEIIKAREVLTTYIGEDENRTTYNFKRQAIQESIYGVDIDSGAIDIAKLRLWLSLVVEEDDYHHIKPLPNLDYKIVCGDSLLTVEKDVFNYTLYNELEALKTAYFDQTDPVKKLEQRAEIDSLIAQLTGDYSQFDMQIYFSEVFHNDGGFDVVIANPPYVRMELIKELKSSLQKTYIDVYSGRADLYVYFFRRGFDILKDNGVLSFITPNKFMRANYGKKLRSYLARETRLQTLIDFGDLPVFDATTYPMITIARKETSVESTIKVLEIKSLDDITTLYQAVERAYPLPQNTLSGDGWQLSAPEVRALMNKLAAAGQPLGEYVGGKIYYGIKTGLNDAFIIDEAQRRKLVTADPKSDEVIKPYLRGRDIKRWIPEKSGLYIIFTHHGFPIEDYPAIEDYLWVFKDRLEARATSANHAWYELQQPQIGTYGIFEKPKIVLPAIVNRATFALDVEGHYSNDKTTIIDNDDLFVLAVLNSSVQNFFFQQTASTKQNGYFEQKYMYIEQISIPENLADDLRHRIISIVQECLIAAQQAPSKLPALETELNLLVYQAYGLSSEDIALLERDLEINSVQQAADFLDKLSAITGEAD